MKNRIWLFAGVLIALHIQAFGQGGFVEARLKVSGVCGMCKSRIETTLDVKGVKYANWDRNTDTLLVVYKPSKISLDRIHTLLAEAGHDTDKAKASDEAYRKVDECCRYRELDKH
jgi:hypothetical protein